MTTTTAWAMLSSQRAAKNLQTGQAQNCIKYQCEQCGHNTMQSELLSSEHKWSSKGATNTIVLASDQSCENTWSDKFRKIHPPYKNEFIRL